MKQVVQRTINLNENLFNNTNGNVPKVSTARVKFFIIFLKLIYFALVQEHENLQIWFLRKAQTRVVSIRSDLIDLWQIISCSRYEYNFQPTDYFLDHIFGNLKTYLLSFLQKFIKHFLLKLIEINFIFQVILLYWIFEIFVINSKSDKEDWIILKH